MTLSSVILVAHNSARSIERCLNALRNEEGWERIVVDNASLDDTLERAQKADPGARLVRNSQNLGFAGGANCGARIASGAIFLLLNPDTFAYPGSVGALAAALAENNVGAAGGMLLDNYGKIDRDYTARRFPTFRYMAAEVLLLNRLWPSNPLNRSYRCLNLDRSKKQEIEQPAGACLAVTRKAWESVGGFDEGFFPVWFEDADFCQRLRIEGWKILYYPDAVFSHSGGHSVNQLNLRDRQLFWYRNMLRYFQKHSGPLTVAGLRTTIALGMILRSCAVLLGFRPEGAAKRDALRAYAEVVLQCVVRPPATGSHKG